MLFTNTKHWAITRVPRRLRFLLSDKAFVEMRYRKRFGRSLNLQQPQTLNEKLNWIKLYDRNPLMTQCADKYAVREIVAKKVGGHLLNELYGIWNSVDEIDFESLPESYVLKATHGSGWNIIVKENSALDRNVAKQKIEKWMRTNYYRYSREWCYKNVKPKIICERYRENEGGQLIDYKFHCFHGKPRLIQVDRDRYTNHTRILYDTRWRPCDFEWEYPRCNEEITPPACLEDMLKTAGMLASDFLFSRIDLYAINESHLFGEISFQPEAGFGRFTPKHWDTELGKLLKLPVEW